MCNHIKPLNARLAREKIPIKFLTETLDCQPLLQENARKWRSFKTLKTHCFASTIIDCSSFAIILVDENDSFTVLGYHCISSAVYTCFRIPGTPHYCFNVSKTL